MEVRTNPSIIATGYVHFALTQALRIRFSSQKTQPSRARRQWYLPHPQVGTRSSRDHLSGFEKPLDRAFHMEIRAALRQMACGLEITLPVFEICTEH